MVIPLLAASSKNVDVFCFVFLLPAHIDALIDL